MNTIGRTIYPGMIVPIGYHPSGKIDGVLEEPRYRIILLEKGAGALRIDNRQIYLIAPALICLNEQEALTIDPSSGYSAQALFFHPHFVNNVFTFENLRQGSSDFSETEYRDRHWFRPFFLRDSEHTGIFKIGPLTTGRVLGLFKRIGSELTDQPDGYWPCRSRSYLLELLFLIERLFMEPGPMNPTYDMTEIPEDINKIILFLNTHYQEKITISELTKIFHMNRTSLAERFQNATGSSVMTYLISLRIHLSALMLRDSMVPVSEIVERVGFGDYTHFNRMFHKFFGSSPNQYRQDHCWLITNRI